MPIKVSKTFWCMNFFLRQWLGFKSCWSFFSFNFFDLFITFPLFRCHGPKPPPKPEFTLKPKKKKVFHPEEPTPGSLCPPCPELVWRQCVGQHIGADRMVSCSIQAVLNFNLNTFLQVPLEMALVQTYFSSNFAHPVVFFSSDGLLK